MVPEGVPAGRCGFQRPSTRNPVDAGGDRTDGGAVSCWREAWNGTGRCIWHAEGEEKSASELRAARADGPERLDGARLDGTFDAELSFRHCSLAGADLSGADLSGANFEYADLAGADLGEATLAETNLLRADLSGATLRGADLADARLPGADLTDADLSFAALTETLLRDADLTRASLRDAKLREVELLRGDLTEADLQDAQLPGANLKDATLSGAKLQRTNLYKANLLRANLDGATLRDAELPRADLRHVDAEGATLRHADLTEANLRNADLDTVDLEDASVARTDLREADLEDARLYQTYFSDVRVNSDTEFGDACIYEEIDALHSWDATPTEAAVWTYRRLQDLHETYALTERARHYHVEKAEAEKRWHREAADRKRFWSDGGWKHWKQWAIYRSNGVLSKHGERPWRVVGVSAAVIAVWSALYLLFGRILVPDGSSGMESIGLGLFPAISLPAPVADVLTSVYFSVVTFTTLGYGDLQPATGFAQALATVESLLGALLMAYLVFVLGRRTNW